MPSGADAVLNHIDGERLIRLAQGMVRIPSDNPPGNEGPVARFLAEHLTRAGIETELRDVWPGRPNVLARWGEIGARPHLIRHSVNLKGFVSSEAERRSRFAVHEFERKNSHSKEIRPMNSLERFRDHRANAE